MFFLLPHTPPATHNTPAPATATGRQRGATKGSLDMRRQRGGNAAATRRNQGLSGHAAGSPDIRTTRGLRGCYGTGSSAHFWLGTTSYVGNSIESPRVCIGYYINKKMFQLF